MVFSSLLFIFAFLAPQLLIYYLIRDIKARNIVLLVFSLIFYGWGGPMYLLLLVIECAVSWLTAREIEKTSFPKMKKAWLILECVVMIGLIFIFKYFGFFAWNLQKIFGWPEVLPEIILPIGISFYTFQLISYVVDVYRGEVEAQPRFYKVLLYASLFHQCIAGPIVRYKTVASEIDGREVNTKDIAEGIRRFAVGLAKKAILANGCAAIADKLAPTALSDMGSVHGAGLWFGMFAYMLQIYLDFSAYSDMAIGMGRMVGFHYLENFDYPYTAGTVQDFWRRWHISLSTFFRDYVYIPLGGSRKGQGRTYLNLLIVWALTGMWHGASWNYIFWGLYYFVFLALERLILGDLLKKNTITKVLGHVYTLLVVFFGWVLFRYTDTAALFATLKGMFGAGYKFFSPDVGSTFINNIFFLIIAVIAVFPLGKKLRTLLRQETWRSKKYVLFNAMNVIDAVTPAALMLLSVLALVGNSYNPFLYFQF